MILEYKSFTKTLFPIPIWRVEIDGINNQQLKEYSYYLKQNTKGIVVSNRGGWHSDEVIEPLPETLIDFINQTTEFVNNYCSQQTEIQDLSFGNFWININSKYSYNRSHDHQKSILSGVYYIDAEGENIGDFVMERPDNAEFFLDNYANKSDFTTINQSLKVKTGSMILLPSWIKHGVEQNLENRDRISLAFNFVGKNEIR